MRDQSPYCVACQNGGTERARCFRGVFLEWNIGASRDFLSPEFPFWRRVEVIALIADLRSAQAILKHSHCEDRYSTSLRQRASLLTVENSKEKDPLACHRAAIKGRTSQHWFSTRVIVRETQSTLIIYTTNRYFPPFSLSLALSRALVDCLHEISIKVCRSLLGQSASWRD